MASTSSRPLSPSTKRILLQFVRQRLIYIYMYIGSFFVLLCMRRETQLLIGGERERRERGAGWGGDGKKVFAQVTPHRDCYSKKRERAGVRQPDISTLRLIYIDLQLQLKLLLVPFYLNFEFSTHFNIKFHKRCFLSLAFRVCLFCEK